MATIALSVVGGLVGGPAGAAIGSMIGSGLDRSMIRGSARREGPRLDDLTVQAADYGAPLARHYGTVRSSGPLIWSSGLKETAHRSGGGKRSGARTTTYSYSASFAVVLSARPIGGVGRIWADGKLLRGSGGDMRTPGIVRIYLGSERQTADPALEAALGLDAAPAHRGLVYAVFEDLELADYANRVPLLSFEMFAGTAASAPMLADLGEAVGCRIRGDLTEPPWSGFSISRPTSLGNILDVIGKVQPLSLISESHGVRVAASMGDTISAHLSETDLLRGGDLPDGAERRRVRSDDAPRLVTVQPNDPARSYLPGLQRALRGDLVHGAVEAIDLPATMSATSAKAVAEGRLARLSARRSQMLIRVPLSQAVIQVGDVAALPDGSRWSVRRTEIEGFGMSCSLERIARQSAAPVRADPGAAQQNLDVPQGATELRLCELPPLGEEPNGTVRVYAAAGGASSGWRYTELLLSTDGGAVWQSAGIISTPTSMGQLTSALPPSDWSRWDEANRIEVEVLDDRPLPSRSRTAVLNGANLMLVGSELVQFRTAEEVAPRRWRLSGLLRGRRGTEAEAQSQHVAGTTALLLDAESLFPIDLPVHHLGSELLAKAVGPNDSAAAIEPSRELLRGRSLLPLPPVFLSGGFESGGTLQVNWVRRSRHGFAWLDGTDAPLAEEREAYAVAVEVNGAQARWTASEPGFRLDHEAQIAAFGTAAAVAHVQVRQVSQLAGPGYPASIVITS